MKNLKHILTALVFIASSCAGVSAMSHLNDGYFGISYQDYVNMMEQLPYDKEESQQPVLCEMCKGEVNESEKITLTPCKHTLHEACFVDHAGVDLDGYGALFGDLFLHCPACNQTYNRPVDFTQKQINALPSLTKERLQKNTIIKIAPVKSTAQILGIPNPKNLLVSCMVTVLLTYLNEVMAHIPYDTMISRLTHHENVFIKKTFKYGPEWGPLVRKVIEMILEESSVQSYIENRYGLSSLAWKLPNGERSTLGKIMYLFALRIVPYYMVNKRLIEGLHDEIKGSINWAEFIYKALILAINRKI